MLRATKMTFLSEFFFGIYCKRVLEAHNEDSLMVRGKFEVGGCWILNITRRLFLE
jgi:hypothetical protein